MVRHIKDHRIAETNRRRVLLTTGAIGSGVVAGCLGDDTDDEVSPADDADDDTVIDDGDDADDFEADDYEADDYEADDDSDDTDDADDLEAILRHDVRAVHVTGEPHPGDAQYADGWNDEALADWVNADRHQYSLLGRSFGDLEYYGEIIEDWEYSPGILEIKLQENIVWWSGKVLDANDLATLWDLRDWFLGGDDLNWQPNIIARDLLDDFRMRISLADTWTEDWALTQTLDRENINSSTDFTQPWLDQFEDTGGDMDAVGDVRDDLGEVRVETDEDIVHHFQVPFEFRLDGSIGDVGEHHWELELVPERNGITRYKTDEINFERLRFWVVAESPVTGEELWLDEENVFRSYDPDEEVDFPTKFIEFEREFDEWGWNMNAEVPPTSNPHFRRAWIWATRPTDWEETGSLPQQGGHPFLTDDRFHSWHSEEIRDDMLDYNELDADWDQAESEMDIGGFERNADGFWIMQEDGGGQSAGEAIDLTIGGQAWMDYVGDLGSDWFSELEDWGIASTMVPDRPGDDPWRVESDYIGGLVPEWVYDTVFGESDLSWTAWNNNLPEAVEAPPLGDANADRDDWETYDTRAMADRLAVTVEPDSYQNIVDQLGWVANTVPVRSPVTATTMQFVFNDNRWHVDTPEDNPAAWIQRHEDRIWYNGGLRYVPEDER